MAKDKILNALAKGAAISVFGIFISKILSYLFRLVVARIGPDAYGQLMIGVAVLNIATAIALLALDEGVNTFVSRFRAKNSFASVKGTVLSAFQISLPVSFLVGLVMYLSAGFISNSIFQNSELLPVIEILAIVPFFSSFSSICIDTINAYKKVEYQMFTNQIFQNSVQLAATFGLISFGFGVVGAAAGWVAGVVLSSLLAFYLMEKKVKKIVTSDVKPRMQHRDLLNFSSPLVAGHIVRSSLGRMDTLLIGYFITDTKVGLYNAALPTASLITMPVAALGTLSLPSFSEARERDDVSVSHVLKNLTRWGFMMAFPAFIVMALFSRQILTLLFTKVYSEASLVLVTLAFGSMVGVTGGYISDLLKTVDKTKIVLINNLSSLSLNFLLNLLLIPDIGLGLGMLGAGTATAATSIIMTTVAILETVYFEGVTPFHPDMWKPIAASIIPLGIVYFSIKNLFETAPVWILIPGGLAFGILYILMLVLIGGINEEERDIIIGAGRRVKMEQEAEKLADIVIR